MKTKLFFGMLLSMCIGAMLAGCSKETMEQPATPTEVAVTSVKLEQTDSILALGSQDVFDVIVLPENASNKHVVWRSDNEAVAKVDPSTGIITAVGEGAALITVTTIDGGKQDTAHISVNVAGSGAVDDILPTMTCPVFRAYCKEEMVEADWDRDDNGKLSSTEASVVTVIDFTDKCQEVASLDGIVYFTGLKTLNCSGNQLTKLDISRNRELTTLNCSGNRLTSIDISSNGNLTSFDCTNNPGFDGSLLVRGWYGLDENIPASFTNGSWLYDGQTVEVRYLSLHMD